MRRVFVSPPPKLLRSLLVLSGIPETELAERFGKSQPYVSHLCTGRLLPTKSEAEYLCQRFAISVEQLFPSGIREDRKK